jgi:hypothetical protein
MPKRRPKLELSREDVGYIAELIDGEGTINVRRHKKNKFLADHYYRTLRLRRRR